MTSTPARADEPAIEPAADAAPEAPALTFADFNVRPDIVEALAAAGIIHPFPIQAMTLPVALDGHDIIGQAKTGTGKTLGLRRADAPARRRPRGRRLRRRCPGAGKPRRPWSVVPTRELAVQVADDLETRRQGRATPASLTIYGGRAYEPQVEALQQGRRDRRRHPRPADRPRQAGHLTSKNVKSVVLDEADEMLDLGFLPDVEKLLALTPAVRQTHAVLGHHARRRRRAGPPLHDPADPHPRRGPGRRGPDQGASSQLVYRAHSMDKVEVVARILQAEGRGRTIIFTKTKRTAAKVAEELVDRGFAAAAIHGDLGQGAREQALRAFRNGKVDVLVATDVAARGIDVDDVTHVDQLPVRRGREDLPAPRRAAPAAPATRAPP